MAIRVKRIYEPADEQDGLRVLVDRLWPRGVSKQAAALDLWLKACAPSTELRQWFHHEPEKWDEFKARYSAELEALRQQLQPLLEAARAGEVTLLYASRDQAHNHAVALRDYLATLME